MKKDKLFELVLEKRRQCEMGSDSYNVNILKEHLTLGEFMEEIANNTPYTFGTIETFYEGSDYNEVWLETVYWGEGECPSYYQRIGYLKPVWNRELLHVKAYGSWNQIDFTFKIDNK